MNRSREGLRKATPFTNAQIVKKLNEYTDGWEHDWTKQKGKAYFYEQELFDDLFEETGVAVICSRKGVRQNAGRMQSEGERLGGIRHSE